MQRDGVTLIGPCRSDLDLQNLVWAISVRYRKLILGGDIGLGV